MTTHSLAIYQLIALCDSAAHVAPVLPFNTEQAHEVMRIHVGCRAKHCPRKTAALQTLIAAGRLIPATSKPR